MHAYIKTYTYTMYVCELLLLTGCMAARVEPFPPWNQAATKKKKTPSIAFGWFTSSTIGWTRVYFLTGNILYGCTPVLQSPLLLCGRRPIFI
jgi:hypothetical protein